MGTINVINKSMIPSNAGITKAWLIKARIKTESPLIMGAGEGENTDKIIQRDESGNPIINGSAFIGCMQSYIKENYSFKYQDTYSEEYFWGTDSSLLQQRRKREQSANLSSQSHLKVYPIIMDKDCSSTIAILDGIKIDSTTNLVVDQGKYDYEAVNNAVTFELRMEVLMREGMKKEDFTFILSSIYDMMKHSRLRIGAFTSNGYGQIAFEEVGIQKFYFPDDATLWFLHKQGLSSTITNNFVPKEVTLNQLNDFSISAEFNIKHGLMTGGYSMNATSDKAHYTFGGIAGLLGKAVKGAINHRMVRIMNTLGIDDAESHLLTLTGWGAEEKKKNQNLQYDAKASRLKIDFTIIGKTAPMLQDRVKIDRYTQETIDGAKYDSEPTWSNGDTNPNLTLSIKIDKCKEWEAALLLQVIKDLWTGDMAIGGEKNVGRGVLKGISATIKYGTKEFTLFDKTTSEHYAEMNAWNTHLLNLKNQ